MTMPVPNPRLVGFACICCERRLPIGDHVEGCLSCLALGYPASVAPLFDPPATPFASPTANGMARFADMLAYQEFISLGEGATPLLALPKIAERLGLVSLLVKDEGANPTGSHKDRMGAQIAARAVDIGAPGIIAASSGNGGLSVATYAQAYGLPCEIVVTPSLSSRYHQAMEQVGAVLRFEANSLARWCYMRERVHRDGWLPATNYLNPPVGSHPCGVDAYKTVAYELLEAPEAREADMIVVPTARGDLLWGIWRGLLDGRNAGMIARLPRLVAVDPFPRLSRVLHGEDYRGSFAGFSAMTAINGATVTYQAVKALRDSGGSAVVVSDADAMQGRELLTEHAVLLELSSAAALAAISKIMGREGRPRQVVLIGTSRGHDCAEGDRTRPASVEASSL